MTETYYTYDNSANVFTYGTFSMLQTPAGVKVKAPCVIAAALRLTRACNSQTMVKWLSGKVLCRENKVHARNLLMVGV